MSSNPFFNGVVGQTTVLQTLAGQVIGEILDLSDDAIVVKQDTGKSGPGRYLNIKVRLSAVLAYHLWDEKDG